MRGFWVCMVAVAVGGILAVGCKQNPNDSAPSQAGDIQVGEYGSMTGSEATFGQSTDEGVMLAVDDANAAGGVLGRKIKVIAEDDRGSQDEAVSAVKKLINRDHAVAILGEVASTNSLAGGGVCENAKIPMISPSSTNPAVTQDKQFVFRVCFTDDFQGRVGAQFAVIKGWKNVAVLTAMDSDYSKGLAHSFHEEFSAFGTIVADESYSKTDRDFKPQLTRIKAANPDAVYLPGYYTQIVLILEQARELGLNVPFFGGDGWDSAETLKLGAAADGCYFTSHYSPDEDRPEVKQFVQAYQAKYAKVPDAMAVTGYDAARVLIDSIRRAGNTNPAAIRDAIAATKNFPGASGVISIDAGHNARKAIVILEIQGGKTKIADIIQPSPWGSDQRMQVLVQQFINGLSIGAVYALIALGYTMVYGVLRLINFAHGDVYMVGAVLAYFIANAMQKIGAPLWLNLSVVFTGAIVGCTVLGLLIEFLAYRPLRNRPRLTALITAIGVSLLLENLMQNPMLFGPTPRQMPKLLPDVPVLSFHVGHAATPISLNSMDVITLSLSLTLMLILTWIVMRTRVGLALRAVSHRFDTSSLMGINTNRIIAFTFVLGSALAAVGGVIDAFRYNVDPLMGIMPGLKAFIAAVLGGIGSIPGAVIGGFLIGFIETLLKGVILPSAYSGFADAAAFCVLILVLLLRPGGLFGRYTPEKV